MTPHVDAALREFEAAMEGWLSDGPQLAPPCQCRLLIGTKYEALKAALALDARDREECRVGCEMEGFPGSLWRFISQCDYRRVTPWYKGERLRDMPQACIFDAAAAAVASIVLQMVGAVVRSQMKPAAREILEHATKFLDRDIDALSQHKKAEAVLRHNLRVVPGGS